MSADMNPSRGYNVSGILYQKVGLNSPTPALNDLHVNLALLYISYVIFYFCDLYVIKSEKCMLMF